MKRTALKTVLVMSLLFGVTLMAAWIDGQFHAVELRVNSSAAGIRMHWGNGVLVMIGLRHFAGPDYPGVNFWRFPHAESFTADGPGFITDRQIFNFGIIYWHAAKRGAGYGFTLPFWFLAPLFGAALPAGCVYFLRRGNEGACDSCGYDLHGTIAAKRTECPECGAAIG